MARVPFFFSLFECILCSERNTAAVLCRVAAVKRFPYINHNADYILFFSFEIRRTILRNQKFMIGLDSYSRSWLLNYWTLSDNNILIVFESTDLLKLRNKSILFSCFRHQILSGSLMRLD